MLPPWTPTPNWQTRRRLPRPATASPSTRTRRPYRFPGGLANINTLIRLSGTPATCSAARRPAPCRPARTTWRASTASSPSSPTSSPSRRAACTSAPTPDVLGAALPDHRVPRRPGDPRDAARRPGRDAGPAALRHPDRPRWPPCTPWTPMPSASTPWAAPRASSPAPWTAGAAAASPSAEDAATSRLITEVGAWLDRPQGPGRPPHPAAQRLQARQPDPGPGDAPAHRPRRLGPGHPRRPAVRLGHAAQLLDRGHGDPARHARPAARCPPRRRASSPASRRRTAYAARTGRDLGGFRFHRTLGILKLGVIFLQLHALHRKRRHDRPPLRRLRPPRPRPAGIRPRRRRRPHVLTAHSRNIIHSQKYCNSQSKLLQHKNVPSQEAVCCFASNIPPLSTSCP